jgi:hypothetical protein
MMSALHLDAIGVGIVVVMLGVLMLAVLMQQRQRNSKTISIWLGSVLVGLLLGSALTLGAFRVREAREAMMFSASGEFALDPAAASSEPEPAGDAGGGMGGRAGGMGGGMGGPNPRRDLATLVRKMELLTGDIKMTLSAEQCVSVAAALAGLDAAEDLSDDDAQTAHDALLASLDDGQKSLLDAIGLPRPPRGAGVPGGGPPAPEANPFHQEVNTEALARLRTRLNQ